MKTNIFIAGLLLVIFAINSNAQDSWTRKANPGGAARSGAVGFSIGNKGYIGTGSDDSTDRNDFWEYDPVTDTWMQKADFAGSPREFAIGFCIGDKGYVGTGRDQYFNKRKDFWEYDPAKNIWTRKADCTDKGWEDAVGFSIENKGYIGTGRKPGGLVKEFWEYDPATDKWTQKADFGGDARIGASGFSINGKGYIGTGENRSLLNDFWEFDPVTNKWTKKADFTEEGRADAVGFSINAKGYIGLGGNSNEYPKDFWEYDPITDKWTREADFAGGQRGTAVGFSIKDKGYVGTGWWQHVLEDFWEYTPDNNITAIPTITSFSPASGPISATVTITGTNFSTNPNNDIVYFGAVRAVVASATATKLKVYVPVGTTYQPINVMVNGLTAYSAKPFVVIFEGGNDAFTQNSFAPKKDFPLGYYPAGFFIGDLDGDGRADFVSGDYNSPTISVFRNKSISGTLSFAPKINFATGGYYVNCVIGDLDGDGKPDIITANSNSNTVSVLRNTSTPGNISFAPKIDFATGNAPEKVILGDLDGDGKPDIVTPNIGEATFSVLKNTSSIGIISLAPHTDYAAATKLYNCAIGDLDGDKKPDIVVTGNYPDHIFSIFKNTSTNGAISFAGKVDYITDKTPRGIAIGDLDGDGKPDLAIGNFTLSGPPNSLSIYRNISSVGTILFDTKVDYVSGGSGADNVSINDLNGDGKPDIILNNYWNDFISLFRNQSSAGVISFDGHVDFTTGSGPRCVNNGTGDLDGDGKLDISLTNIFTGTVSVLRSLIGDNGCTPPSNLNVTNITGSSAKLTWTLPVVPVSSFEIRYRIVGDSAWLYRKAGGTQTGITLTNLLPGTPYQWQVRSNCGGEITIGLIGPGFTTAGLFASSISADAMSYGKSNLYISPNPVTGNMLNLHITNATANNYQLSIADMQGRMLITQNVLLNGSSNKTIDVSALPRGAYILKVMNNKNEQPQIKFVKAN